jgi:SEC-C motif-containing protein
MKISVNSPCPCGSKEKYKKCCQKYHKGALPKDALSLMKTRYSAYAIGNADYIIQTTHPENPDYHDDKKVWKNEIEYFCEQTTFKSLKIISYEEDRDVSYVHFLATFAVGMLNEKSTFVKLGNRWLYKNGEIRE